MDEAVTLPGTPPMIAAARAYVAALLAGTPRADDATLITSELATNALAHTPSGAAGEFTVRVESKFADGWCRISVEDQGAIGWSRAAVGDEDAESGRGLTIVAALADRSGHRRSPQGTVAWAELTWAS